MTSSVSERLTREGVVFVVGATIGFGLILYGFQTGNLLYTMLGGVVMLAAVLLTHAD